MNRSGMILLLFFGLGAMHAQAQTPGPAFKYVELLPAPAHAGQVLVARSYYQSCFAQASVGSHAVSVADHVITVDVQMIPFPEDLLCPGTLPPSVPIDFIIGTLPPGDYTLVENAMMTSGPGSFSPLTLDFTVGPAIAVIPAASTESLAGLALLMLLLAWRGMATRVE